MPIVFDRLAISSSRSRGFYSSFSIFLITYAIREVQIFSERRLLGAGSYQCRFLNISFRILLLFL